MSWTHLEDTTPRAAKPYQCYLCERTIPTGERHVLRVGANEDGIVRTRMHETCEKLTHDWDEWDWMSHDASEFREYMGGEEQ